MQCLIPTCGIAEVSRHQAPLATDGRTAGRTAETVLQAMPADRVQSALRHSRLLFLRQFCHPTGKDRLRRTTYAGGIRTATKPLQQSLQRKSVLAGLLKRTPGEGETLAGRAAKQRKLQRQQKNGLVGAFKYPACLPSLPPAQKKAGNRAQESLATL